MGSRGDRHRQAESNRSRGVIVGLVGGVLWGLSVGCVYALVNRPAAPLGFIVVIVLVGLVISVPAVLLAARFRRPALLVLTAVALLLVIWAVVSAAHTEWLAATLNLLTLTLVVAVGVWLRRDRRVASIAE